MHRQLSAGLLQSYVDEDMFGYHTVTRRSRCTGF